MNEHQIDVLLDLLKTGGIVAGLVLGLVLAFLFLKYVIPVVASFKPTNGDKHSGGATFLLLKQAAELPEVLRSLVAEVKENTQEMKNVTGEFKVMKDYMWTKAEVIEENAKNRHDVANILQAPVASFHNQLYQGLTEIRNAIEDRRQSARRRTHRRAK